MAYDEGCEFTLGRANVLREGSDASVIANGVIVPMALEAAGRLAAEGISVRVLDMHTVKPLDTDTIVKTAIETGAMVTAEEHSVIGGLGSAVAETLVEERPTPMERVGIMDHFGESSRSYTSLMAKMGLTSGAIEEAVQEAMKRWK